MASDNPIEILSKLVKLDIDATHAYEEALENIEHSNIKVQISSFKQDHERHIRELSDCIRDLGGEAPKMSKDFKGYLIEGFTKVRSLTGTEGALKAMKSNEMLTNKIYQEALNQDFTPRVREVVRKNREDERRHLEYIETCLREESWKKERPASRTRV